MKEKIKVKELISDTDWESAFPVLKEFRPEIDFNDLIKRRSLLIKNRYKLFGLLIDEKIVAIAGVVEEPHILRNSELRVNDLATLSSERSKGYGKLLLDYLQNYALEKNFSRILLYSRLNNLEAHRFYEDRAGFSRHGIEFALEIKETSF